MPQPGDDGRRSPDLQRGSLRQEGVPSVKGSSEMAKFKVARVLYFLGVVAAFVVAAGADRKFDW